MDISLKEFFLTLLEERKQQFNNRFEAMDKAVSTATSSLDKRLDTMNEFRNTLKDQNATFLTKTEYDNRHTELSKQIEDLKLSRAEMAGKASQSSVNLAYAVTGIGLIISIVSLILRIVIQ